MGKRATLLEGLCGHALSFGADVLHVEHENGHDLVYARNGKTVFRIAKYATNSSDAKELRNDLSFGIRKPLLRLLNGQRWILRVVAGSADRSVHVAIEPAPPLDPNAPPSFSAKQGQYLAFIYYYSKINGMAPAETDFQRYFGVTPPAVHQMVVTLELNGLIARTPGQGRSIRLLVPPECLPPLE